ncbi:MAG: hypothetical protein ACFB9M_08810 [Myxococcota bacterium]
MEESDALKGALAELCRTQGVVGGVVCDDAGETVVSALGVAELPERARENASEHVPRRLPLSIPVSEFLLRLGSAEVCGLLRRLQTASGKRGVGSLTTIQLRYGEVDLLVRTLPQDFYLVVVVRRPTLLSVVAERLHRAGAKLKAELEV